MIVAVANAAGGTFLLDVDARIVHALGIRDGLEAEIGAVRSGSITPRPAPNFEILPRHRPQVLAVQVHLSAMPARYLKRKGAESGTDGRIGSTNGRAANELATSGRNVAWLHPRKNSPHRHIHHVSWAR